MITFLSTFLIGLNPSLQLEDRVQPLPYFREVLTFLFFLLVVFLKSPKQYQTKIFTLVLTLGS